MTIDAHKMSDGEVRDPRMLTAYVASQLMRKATQVVYRDKYGDRYSLLHEVVCHNGKNRLGWYRLVVEYQDGTRTADGTKVTRVSHIFDLQICMDLRDGWQDHVENKVLQMMQQTFGGGIPDDAGY